MGFLLPTAHTERHHRAAPCFPARHPRERKNLSFSYKKNELNSVRLELEDTRETLKAVTARRADIEEELVAIRERLFRAVSLRSLNAFNILGGVLC